MSKFRHFILSILLIITLTSCADRTEYGECIGINDKPKPDKNYKYSGWNIGLGIVFIETIIVPIVVVLDELKCPTSDKEQPNDK